MVELKYFFKEKISFSETQNRNSKNPRLESDPILRQWNGFEQKSPVLSVTVQEKYIYFP